jgi:UDP-GlcNAc:undecaprenyl-phosphate/decaprenyl-phosphate GlcNAc-1-phosphate transferase
MREYLLVLLVTAAVTYLLTPLVRRVAIATGAMHEPRARDTHTKPTPLLGGLAMYGGLVAGLIIATRLSFLDDPFAEAGSRTAAGLLLAGALVVVVGFIDDRWGLSAVSKLAGQVAAAGILVWSGQSLPWVPMPNGGVFSLEQDLGVTVTILLVVVTINAINFIDGLDGLAAGIVAVAALSFLVYSYTLIRTIGITSQSLPAVSSALLAGMCIGFLPHNFYPARIFMGDIGAMLLGLMLAYGPISSTASLDPALLTNYAQPHTLDRFPTLLPLLVPAAIFVIPYADLMFAIIRRTRAGKPLMAADRQHLHHRLLNIGHSYRQSVLIMYLWAALFSVTVVSLSVVRTRLVVFEAATLIAVLTLLPVTMPRLRPWAWRKPVPVAAGNLPRSGRAVPAPAAVVSRRAAPPPAAAPLPAAAPFPRAAPFPPSSQPPETAPFPRAPFPGSAPPASSSPTEAPPLPGGSLPHAGRLPEPETVNPVNPVSPLGSAYPADPPGPLPGSFSGPGGRSGPGRRPGAGGRPGNGRGGSPDSPPGPDPFADPGPRPGAGPEAGSTGSPDPLPQAQPRNVRPR